MIEIEYNGAKLKISPTMEDDPEPVVRAFMQGARKEEIVVVDVDGPIEVNEMLLRLLMEKGQV